MHPKELAEVGTKGVNEVDQVIVEALSAQVPTEVELVKVVPLAKVVQLALMPAVPVGADEESSKPQELLEALTDEPVGAQVDEVIDKELAEVDLANAVDHQVLNEDQKLSANINKADTEDELAIEVQLALMPAVPLRVDEVNSKPLESLEAQSNEPVGVQVDEVGVKELAEEDLDNAVDHQVLNEDQELSANVNKAGTEDELATVVQLA
eukprot:2030930-Amphidinium_carterae.1